MMIFGLVPRHKVVQLCCAFAASIGGLITGILLGWSSALPFLPSIPLDAADIPFAASLLNLGALLFAIPGGKLADYVGRTTAMLFFMTLFMISYTISAFTTSTYTIFGCRFVAGMGMGGVGVVNNMYNVEIGEMKFRGVVGGIYTIMVTQGLLLVNLMTLWCGWEEYNLVPAIFPIIYAVCFLVMPESPVYLVAKGNIDQARKNLSLLRNSDGVDSELASLRRVPSKAPFSFLFSKKSNLRALFAGMGIHALQQLSGITAFDFYTDNLLKEAEVKLEPNISGIAVTAFMAITVLFTFTMDTRGRKFFLTTSAIVTTVGHFTLGLYFHLRSLKITFELMPYIPIVALMIFMFGFNLGLGPVPWILTAEIFPPNVRGYGSGFMVVTNWLMSIVVTLFFPVLLDKVGKSETFYGFACVGVGTVIFVNVVVPETRGKDYL